MTSTISRARLRARYVFTGSLVMDTALHIGGGRDQPGASDSPVVRDPAGRPFIPGSSFKGAFRAAVERLTPNLAHLGLGTCALQPGYADCMTTHRGAPAPDDPGQRAVASLEERAQWLDLGEAYRVVSGAIGDRLKPRDVDVSAALIRLERRDLAGQVVTDETLLELLDRWLCNTCKVFGSPFLAATAHFADLPVREPWYDLIQVRDGVGIDRDSERARERIKYDFEVVPPGATFAFQLTLENPGPHDLGLVAVGLHEFVNGMVSLGGIRSRGLGRCRLTDLTVETVNFADPLSLRTYLTQNQPAAQDAGPFLTRAIDDLLSGREA